MIVADARYISGYKVCIRFSDQTEKVIDFEPFLTKHPHPQYDKYKELSRFKTFKIENGNLVWGKNWDLIFPIEELHRGMINI